MKWRSRWPRFQTQGWRQAHWVGPRTTPSAWTPPYQPGTDLIAPTTIAPELPHPRTLKPGEPLNPGRVGRAPGCGEWIHRLRTMNDTVGPGVEIGLLGHREGAVAAAATEPDDAAYGALVGEAAIRGLHLLPPADCAGLTIEEGFWGRPSGAADDFVDDGTVGWFQVGVSRELTPATISLVCECAYAACRDVGPFTFQGLALRFPAERVVYDHSLVTSIAERLPVHGPAAMRPVTITVAGREDAHAASGLGGTFSTMDDLLALVADAAGWELRHEKVGSPDVSAGRACMSMRVPYWSHTMAAFLCALVLAADDAGLLTGVRVRLGGGPTA